MSIPVKKIIAEITVFNPLLEVTMDDGPPMAIGENAIGETESIRLGSVEVLYLSNHSHEIGSTRYLPRINQEAGLILRLQGWDGAEITQDTATQALGSMVINNPDGLLDEYLRYGWDGRDVRIAYIDGSRAVEEITIYRGTVASISWDELHIRVVFSDPSTRFDTTVQRSTYAGTGGREGEESLEGLWRPEVFGMAPQVKPVLIDRGNRIYQVASTPVNLIYKVEDGGLDIPQVVYPVFPVDVATYEDLVAYEWPEPVGGRFITCLAEGMFRIESEPAYEITAWVSRQCYPGPPGSPNTLSTGSIIATLISEYIDNPISPVDTNLNHLWNEVGLGDQNVGFYTGTSPISVQEMIDRLLQGVFTFRFFRYDTGALRVVLMREDSTASGFGSPVFNLLTDSIQTPIVPVSVAIPARQVRASFNRVWFPLSEDQLRSTEQLTEDEIAAKSQPQQWTAQVDAAAADKHFRAAEIDIEGYFSDKNVAAATALARAVLGARTTMNEVYVLTYEHRFPLDLEPGQLVRLELPNPDEGGPPWRLGLSNLLEREFLIVGVETNLLAGITRLIVAGSSSQ